MNEVANIIDYDDDFSEEQSDDTTLTSEIRYRQRNNARRRIEALREEAALKRYLDDDILDRSANLADVI